MDSNSFLYDFYSGLTHEEVKIFVTNEPILEVTLVLKFLRANTLLVKAQIVEDHILEVLNETHSLN